MEINVEMAAVYGSIYGILISVILCLIVVVILSHDWRIVVSMFLTIFAILTTLLALFRIFGWKIGIVEAISLSILVGNSLDYCIHLTEGYISTDSRHLAFVERFKVRSVLTVLLYSAGTCTYMCCVYICMYMVLSAFITPH